jgi:hypothetical protein
MAMINTYKKLANGTYGAWIDCGYGRTAIDRPEVGATVAIRTKSGEVHQRVIAKVLTSYKSGMVVALEADATVAAQAQARLSAAIAARKSADLTAVKTRAQMEREYDAIQNEGYSDGYNPYRTDRIALGAEILPMGA